MSIHDNQIHTQKKTALLVGGTSATGQALCAMLINRGYRCIVHGGTAKAKLEKMRCTYGDAVHTVQHHAENPGELSRALEVYYAVDLLCILYGPMEQQPSANTNADDWMRMMEWNYNLPVEITMRAAPCMKGGATIVYFGFLDEYIRKTFTHSAAYATAKQSLHMFVRQIAPVLREKAIRCFAIAPDFIDDALLSEEQRRRWRSYAETGKLLEAQDIVSTMEWILDAPTVVNALIVPIKKW